MASSDLLAQIQAGRKLKKATTNDRSAPAVDGKSSGGGGGGGRPAPSGGGGLGGIAAAIGAQSAAAGGMLSAGGAKLKPVANAALGMHLIYVMRS
jgi:hypothetical protein